MPPDGAILILALIATGNEHRLLPDLLADHLFQELSFCPCKTEGGKNQN